MIAEPVNQDQSQQDRFLQEYKQFLQNKIKDLDNKTNQVIFTIAEVFFESSQRVKKQKLYNIYIKSDIYEKWIKVHSSKIIAKEISESQKSIELTIKLIHEKQLSIVNHTRLVLEVQLPVVQDDRLSYHQYDKRTNKNDKIQNISYRSNPSEEPTFLNTECPICFKQMSNGSSYVKHMRLHDIEIQSQGYDCPHCEGSFSQCNLLLKHLYKIHFVADDYHLTKRKSYYCPFMKQKFASHQSSQLAHFIRSSPHYTKAIDQIMIDQLEPQQQKLPGQDVANKKINPAHLKTEFIRGVTKGVFIHEKLYGCPLCGLQEFETLKFLGGHIKNAHGVKYRNKLYCPHCQLEYNSARDLSTHLICIHGEVEESSLGTRHQIYTTLDGVKYGDFTKLSQHIINDENYLTFFNSACKIEPIAQDRELNPDLIKSIEDNI